MASFDLDTRLWELTRYSKQDVESDPIGVCSTLINAVNIDLKIKFNPFIARIDFSGQQFFLYISVHMRYGS